MDDLEAAYDRIDDALEPPGDAAALVAARVAQRRRRRQTVRAVVGSAAAVAVIAGTAWTLQGDDSATEPAPPAGSDWAAPSGTTATDPIDPPTALEPGALTVEEANLTCSGPSQVAIVQNPTDYDGSEDGPQTVEPWRLADTEYGFHRIDDDQIVARFSTQDDAVYAELGLIAIDGRWRVESVAACVSAYPGLAAVTRDGSITPAPGIVTAVGASGPPATVDTLGRLWVLRGECGQLPEGTYGLGQATSTGDVLRLVDLSGTTLTFDPVGAPGTMSCDPPPPSPSGPLAQLDVSCDGATWRVGTVVNPEVQAAGYRNIAEAVRPWLGQSWTYDLRQVDDDNAVANLNAPNDVLRASIGFTRIDGSWRVQSASVCTTDFPGLEAAEVFGSGLPLVELVAVDEGHCWIDTLFYRGRHWDLRDEDQFGWGGLGPDVFLGIGSVTWDDGGESFVFTDLAGARLDFVPADTPGTDVNEGGCA